MKLITLFILLFCNILSAEILRGESLEDYKELVVAKVKERVPRLNQCYQNGVNHQGKIASKRITFVFTIANEGYIEMIHVKEAYPMDVLRCVNTNLAGLKFSPPPGGKSLKIQVPLNFKLTARKKSTKKLRL